MPDNATRRTARAIILDGNQLLVIERWRRDRSGQRVHYFSIPGGQIEQGESHDQAIARELAEELSLHITVGPLVAIEHLPSIGQEHYYFVCQASPGELSLKADSPEAARMGDDNRYHPRWLALDDAGSHLHLIYQPLLPLISRLASGDLPDRPLEITPGLV